MAYYLDINPSNQSGNQYVTIPSITLTGDFTIEIDCEIYNTTTTGADGFLFSGGTSGGGFEFYRDSTAQNYRPSLWYNNVKNFSATSNVWPYASGSTANPRKITIQRVGGVVSSNFAGTAGTNVNIASGNNIVISAISARPNGTFTVGMRLYRLRIYQGSTLVRDYNAANTSSGVALVDDASGQNGTIQNPPAGNAQWVFYSSGGATYSGGAATSYALDTVGGGLSLRLGGAVTTYTIDTVGGGTRTTSAGAPTSYALDSTGGGTRTTSAGAVTTYTIDTLGGGDVIKGATASPGGAAVTFAADATGGGVVIRGGGALLNFTAETTGGATRATTGGGAITVSLITVGGGDVLGPGYKPTITAPAVAVRRTYTGQGARVVKTYRAPYTVATQKTFRGPTCRL